MAAAAEQYAAARAERARTRLRRGCVTAAVEEGTAPAVTQQSTPTRRCRHPEVYVLVLPSFGFTSALLANELGGVIVNTAAMVVALVTIGSVSMAVYGHHLYTTGLSVDDRAYYSFATYLIAIPTGVKYFTWLSAMHGAGGVHSAALHAVVGLLWYFAVGGLTGVVLANGALDQPLHDAYYVVAHFHLVMAVSIMYGVVGYVLAELVE